MQADRPGQSQLRPHRGCVPRLYGNLPALDLTPLSALLPETSLSSAPPLTAGQTSYRFVLFQKPTRHLEFLPESGDPVQSSGCSLHGVDGAEAPLCLDPGLV